MADILQSEQLQNNGDTNDIHERGSGKWKFKARKDITECGNDLLGIRGWLTYVMSFMEPNGKTPIPLGHGDPAAFECFRASAEADDALKQAISSAKYNCYAPHCGLLDTRRAVAEYLSSDLPYKLSEEDVVLTCGCAQAIDAALTILGSEGANLLLPRPGYQFYEALLQYKGIEARHYDMDPEKDWEIDLDKLNTIVDDKTAAMVIINPNNPCGNVFSYNHLSEVAQTARRLGFLIISDEVYAHFVFGGSKYTPMGVFASTVPVLTVGSISKRFLVPGWRLGWLATCDPNGILDGFQIKEGIEKLMNIFVDPATVIQAAVPAMLKNTPEDFYMRTLNLLGDTAETCYNILNSIPSLHSPLKPQGCMFLMVKIDMSSFKDLNDDIDFSTKLANEESVVVLPGSPLGMKKWIRVTFAVPPTLLIEGLARIEAFCKRHVKNAM